MKDDHEAYSKIKKYRLKRKGLGALSIFGIIKNYLDKQIIIARQNNQELSSIEGIIDIPYKIIQGQNPALICWNGIGIPRHDNLESQLTI